jgi:hypothetical protein
MLAEMTTLELVKGAGRAAAHRDLLIVCKGPGAVPLPAPDGYDLLEIYFHPSQHREAETSSADYVVFDPDRNVRKLGVVAKLLRPGVQLPISDYDRAMIADDDITPVGCSVADIFRLAAEVEAATGCRISQPGLTRESPHSHPVLLVDERARFAWRRTSFVEVMTPVFTRDALREHSAFFHESVMGWGYDVLWSVREMRAGRPLAVLDATPVHHSRPIGKGIAYSGLALAPETEADNFMRRHSVLGTPVGFAFGGVTPEGEWLGARCDPPPALRLPCEAAAVARFQWLREERWICEACMAKTRSYGELAGIAVQFRKLTDEEREGTKDPRAPRASHAIAVPADSRLAPTPLGLGPTGMTGPSESRPTPPVVRDPATVPALERLERAIDAIAVAHPEDDATQHGVRLARAAVSDLRHGMRRLGA